MTSGRESLFLNLVTWSQNESWGDFDQWFSFNPGIGRKKNSNVVAQNSNLIEILTSHIQKVGSLVGKKARGLEFLLDVRAGICTVICFVVTNVVCLFVVIATWEWIWSIYECPFISVE
jgi:hypothetical protein